MVGGQVAGRVAAGGVAFGVQHLGGGHVDVLPACAAEPIAEVDVFHVHEVALVEAGHLGERRAAQQQAQLAQAVGKIGVHGTGTGRV